MARWIRKEGGVVPQDAFKAGRDGGRSVYVAQIEHNGPGSIFVGKAVAGHSHAYFGLNGQEVPVQQYDVLCGYAFYWVPIGEEDNLHAVSIETEGKTIYIGRIQLNETVDIIGTVLRIQWKSNNALMQLYSFDKFRHIL